MVVLKKIIFVFVLLFSSSIFSQKIVADRPDQTESAITVGKNNFQFSTKFYSKY